jgi:hypothetical protein
MQAGLTPRRLTLREIFSSRILFLASKNVSFALFDSALSVSLVARGMPLAAEQHLMPEAPKRRRQK